MCSLNEEDIDVMPEIEVTTEPLSQFCKKCSGSGSVTLRKKDVYCSNCFTVAVNHKFRASLGKNKTIRTNQKVAVAVSGGLASCVLINFVFNGLNEDAHKKLRIDPVCIYIDEESNADESQKKCEFMLEQAVRYKLPLYIAHIGWVLNDALPVLKENTIPVLNCEVLDKMIRLRKEISSSTSELDLVVKLRRKLLLRCAESVGCSVVMSGETSTTLAGGTLSNLALGRGAHIENDVSFCDSRDSIKILKPIRDVSHEELNYYANIKKISFLPKTEFPKDSIQHTIEKFVIGLQENFPATISTICKTGEKMGHSGNTSNDIEEVCIICQSALDTQDVNSSALQATNFSRVVSSTGPHHRPPTSPAMACHACTCSNKTISSQDIQRLLCYGCRLVSRDIKDVQLLDYLKNSAAKELAVAKMRDQINDFLL